MRYSLLFILFFARQVNCYSQTTSNLKSRFQKADSIVLIKHLQTDNPVIIVDGSNKRSFQRKLLLGNKLNRAIVLKSVSLNLAETRSLLDVLIAKDEPDGRQTMQCFWPRHSILIYTKGKISFIKLCFVCLEFETSADIKMPEAYFSKQKWSKLQDFFSEFKLYVANEDLLK